MDLGFGKFTRLLDSELNVAFMIENQMDCFTWAVPYGEGYDPSIWINYLSEFSEVVWILILVGEYKDYVIFDRQLYKKLCFYTDRE